PEGFVNVSSPDCCEDAPKRPKPQNSLFSRLMANANVVPLGWMSGLCWPLPSVPPPDERDQIPAETSPTQRPPFMSCMEMTEKAELPATGKMQLMRRQSA